MVVNVCNKKMEIQILEPELEWLILQWAPATTYETGA